MFEISCCFLIIPPVNICVLVFAWTYAFFLSGKYLRVQCLDHMANVRLTLLRNCQTGCTIFHSLQQCVRVPSSTTLPMLGMISLFNFSYSHVDVVVSDCSFNLQFPNDVVEHIFICLFANSISSLLKFLLKNFPHLFIIVSLFS